MRGSRSTYCMTLFAALCGGWGLLFFLQACAQREPSVSVPSVTVHTRPPVTKASIRGLFLVNDSVGWASGSGGTFLRMVDGENWTADTIAGYTHCDFRDVHAFDAQHALLMAAGEEGRIIRTTDGGISWTEVYTRLDSGIFLDGMDFRGNVGYCFGDPIHGTFVVIRSDDFGSTWEDVSAELLPRALAKEAGFAASGTGIVATEGRCFIATGGDSVARVMVSAPEAGTWKMVTTPVRSGDGCGIFSLAVTAKNMVAVGGCYLDSTNAAANCAVSTNGGETWRLIEGDPPRGYRSCVAYAEKWRLLVACGRTGVDYSTTEGISWMPLVDEGFYTCALADSTGWMMGKHGKAAKLRFR